MTASKLPREGILKSMIYVFRVRRFVKATLDAHDTVKDKEAGRSAYYNHPLKDVCISRFKKINKKYDTKTAHKILAIATSGNYIQVMNRPEHGLGGYNYPLRLAVTGKGIKLLTPTGFINALAESVSRIAPIISVIISLLALALSAVAIFHKN